MGCLFADGTIFPKANGSWGKKVFGKRPTIQKMFIFAYFLFNPFKNSDYS
jgi:hypothetical protein